MLTSMAKGELLTRSAAIAGVGAGTKSVTIRPGNPELSPPAPSVQGLFTLFDEERGHPVGLVDGAFLTLWKTVADSLLGAHYLVSSDAKSLAVIGTGPIAKGLLEGYAAMYPRLTDIRVWGRTTERAQAIADTSSFDLVVCETAEAAVRGADIVTSATGAKSPIIMGEWIKQGAHVDLVGAHSPDMREADDKLISTASLCRFARNRSGTYRRTTHTHFYGCFESLRRFGRSLELVGGDGSERYRNETTVFKNGGGAHLDLMMANYFFEQARK